MTSPASDDADDALDADEADDVDDADDALKLCELPWALLALDAALLWLELLRSLHLSVPVLFVQAPLLQVLQV